MRIKYIIFHLLLLQLSFPDSVFAQAEIRFDPLKDDISSILPPLSVLLDSAIANNHFVQFRNLQIIINNCKLKTSRVDWTRNIGLQINVGYGNFYNYSTNSSSGVVPPDVASNRSESKYNGVVYLNMPFSTLVDRKNQIKLAKTEIEQAQQMAGQQRFETRQLVINQYNDLILKQRLLRIKSKYFETARINMQMVEKEFANGITPITEYSRISQIFSYAESDYESSQTDFVTAYMILEEIVGMKFHLTDQKSNPDDGN